MAIDEILIICANYSALAIISIMVPYALLKFWLPGYLNEKGKNLATKEDVAEITEKIEAIRRQHAELLEDLKAKNQLRLAAVEQRLRSHQEAY